MSRPQDCPGWFWLLLGVFLASLGSEAGVPSRSVVEAGSENARLPYKGNRAADLDSASVHELRQVPGVGQLRALAIARARWKAEREGREFDVLEVSGIGPALATQLATWGRND